MGRQGRDRPDAGAASGAHFSHGEGGPGLCEGVSARCRRRPDGGRREAGRGERGGLMGAADAFETQRGRLIGLAYRMLGSRADAEDAVQDAWLKWSTADRAAV